MPRILVVDEHDSQARLIAIGLRVEGFEAETAPSAETALARLAAEPFDGAIFDLMLPGMNGIQLARRVRDEHPDTCVVLMSAYHLSERQLSRADCGAVGFVPKPLDLTEVAAFLRAKLAGAKLSDGRWPEASGAFELRAGESGPGARRVAAAR